MAVQIGFTGTQGGMTEAQKVEFTRLYVVYSYDFPCLGFHYGDCVGADEQAFDIVTVITPNAVTWSHPPIDSKKRAWTKADHILDPKPYLERNHDIVDVSHMLIACPKGPEELRSGTWATVRYARKKDLSLLIIQPDGAFAYERK